MSNQVTIMSDTVEEMSRIVRTFAEPWQPGDSVKAGINRAARRLRLTYRRATTFWYGRQCNVLATEADQMRAAYASPLGVELRAFAERAAELRERQNALRGRLHATDCEMAFGGVPENV